VETKNVRLSVRLSQSVSNKLLLHDGIVAANNLYKTKTKTPFVL